MVEHRIGGWWPGTLVGAYDARAQEAQRDRRDPPAGVPLATAGADALGVAILSVPAGVLLAYGTRIDGRAGWIRTRARRSETSDSETAGSEPTRSEPEPAMTRPQPPPMPRKPTFHVGARGAEQGRRR